MNPGAFLAGGGGGGGQGSGDSGGADGSGKGGQGQDGGNDANGGGNGSRGCGAGSGGSCPNCHAGAQAGDPIDVATGRVFTLPTLDVRLSGPLPLEIHRSYSSHAASRDVGLGYGWIHSLAWELVVRTREVDVWDDNGTMLRIDRPRDPGDTVVGPKGRQLFRETWGYTLEIGGLRRLFQREGGDGKTYRLGAVEDRNGNRITLRYDPQGHLREIEDSVGRIVRVRLTPDGRIGAFEVKNAPEQGRWVRFAEYRYNESGDLVTVTDGCGNAARMDYHEGHLLKSVTEPDSLTFHFVYDRQGRCTQSWGALLDGRVPGLSRDAPALLADGVTRAKGFLHCKIEYGADGYREIVDSVQVRRVFINPFGLADKTVSGGHVVARSFDENGFIIGHSDALGATTSMTRDRRGNLLSLTDALGHTKHIARNTAGQIVEVRDSLGVILSVSYDGRGNAIEIRKSRGELTTRKYDPRGNMVRQVLANGAEFAYEYDVHCNLTQVVEPGGRVWQYRYDWLGQRVAQTDPRGAEVRYVQDECGRCVAMYFPNGGIERRTYDGVDRIVQLEEPDGQIWKIGYLMQHRTHVVHPGGAIIQNSYDREGRLLEIQNEKGEIRAHSFNVDGLVTEVKSFDGRTQRFEYDAANRLNVYIDGKGDKREYVRDLLGRIVAVHYPDGTETTFNYDPRGQLIDATYSAGKLHWERDEAGLAVLEVCSSAGTTWTVERQYDVLRSTTRLRTTLGHDSVVVRDALGRAAQSKLDGTDSIEFAYDPVGRELRRVFSLGATHETEYGLVGPYVRRRVTAPSGAATAEPDPTPEWVGPRPTGATVAKAFRYSLNGRQVARWDQSFGALEYEYDAREQLTATLRSRGAYEETFRYDECRNVSEGSERRVYGPGNVLLRKGNAEFVYDPDGALIEKITHDTHNAPKRWRYEWSGQGRLARVLTPDGLEVAFEYDPFARRVRKEVRRRDRLESVLVSSTGYVWSDDRIIHEIQERASEKGDPIVRERTYAYDPNDGAPLGHKEDVISGSERITGSWVYYVNDPQGTPEHVVSGSGVVVGEIHRSAWGYVPPTSDGAEQTPHRFLGQWADPETGLYYNRYRYYDPDSGRYISQDPAGGLPDPNLYSYCLNPIGWVDPLGLVHAASAVFTPADTNVPPIDLGTTTSSYDSEPDDFSRSYNRQNGITPWQNLTSRDEGALTHRTSDTEQQFLRQLENRDDVRLKDGTLTINGRLPPCSACHREMQSFATTNQCAITYNFPDPKTGQATSRHYPTATEP
jgi:RHS repeat-associated protein